MKRVVGKIAGFHGVKGEIKILPLVDDVELYQGFDSVDIDDKDYKVESYRVHKQMVLLKLDGYDDRNSVEAFKGYIKAELNEVLLDSEYYIADLIGLDVVDQNHEKLGTVQDFSNSGQQLLHIKLNKSFESSGDLLVPFVEKYIMEVSLDRGLIQIHNSEELLELCMDMGKGL